MSTVKERWAHVLRLMNINQSEFIFRTQFKQSYASQLLSGTLGKKGIAPDRRKVIRRAFPEINLEWVETGSGSPLIDGSSPMDAEPQPGYGITFIDKAALYAMQAFILSPEGVKDPTLIAKRSYQAAEKMEEIRLQRLRSK